MSRYCRRLLLTFDAFGTLFQPRETIGKSYADLARKHGLSGFSENQIDSSFRNAFKQVAKHAPNYGKQIGMGTSQWWTNVIQITFQPFSPSLALPKQLVPELLTRFSSSQGYTINPHVLELFQFLRRMRQTPDKELNALDITVGVITNSDDRIPGILSSLGLNVGSPRHGMGLSSQNSNSEEDINFVAMSYDVGHEKPAREIFDAARALAGASPTPGSWCLHVGDDLDKDYKGAKAADWESVLLCKPDHAETLYTKGIPYITDLLELKDHIIGDAAEVHLQSRQRLRGMRAER